MNLDHGYLQHGAYPGPFRTEKVRVRHLFADRYQAFYEGQWRNVYIRVHRLFIVYKGEKITIEVDGL